MTFCPEYLSAFHNTHALQTQYGTMLSEHDEYVWENKTYPTIWEDFAIEALIKRYLEELVKIGGNID